MAVTPRVNPPVRAVLLAFIQEPTGKRYGLDLSQETGLPAGTLYPVLIRLESCGWLESHWEDVDPIKEGRPRRRYYRLTSDGLEHVRAALAQRERSRRIRERLLPQARLRPALFAAH